MALDIVAWHDRTTADHQIQLNNAAAAGYRTISLCVYGDRNDPRYAASMIKRAALVGERQFFGLDAAAWQAKFNEMAAQGWGPEIVSAMGPANNPVFAACFIQTGSIPLTRHGMTAGDFDALNKAQMTAGNILRWADVYGNPGDLRFIGVWVANTDKRAWNCDGFADSLATVQARFNALVSGFARPVHMATTPEMGNLVMYDDSTGGQWDARDNMTSAEYQTRFNTLYPQGLRPVRVSAQGTGGNARFSAIFATREDSDARTLRMSGASGSSAVAAIDDAMVAVMTANMLRGASLAIVHGTRLVYAKGYTMAEAGYPDVQPTTFFRQASVSKMFTAAAIYQLIDEGAHLPGSTLVLALDTHLATALPNIANGPPVAHWNDITIRHLLEMTSGVTANILGSDPGMSPTLPVNAMTMAQWLYRQPLTNTPGDKTKVVYSNAGYMLLGMVVARIRGAANYIGGIGPLLNKLQMTRVRSAVTLASGQPADEVRYHSRPLTALPSVMAVGQPLCALGYGEWNLEDIGGGGGLSAAATDVARLLAALSVTYQNPMMSLATLQSWMANAAGNGAYPHGFDDVFVTDAANHLYAGDKGGSMTTSQNGVHFETGGISTVICWNGMTPTGPNWFSPYQVLTDAARNHDWGTTDLFPTFGMPAFPVLRLKPLPPRPIPPRKLVAPHMLPQNGLPKNM